MDADALSADRWEEPPAAVAYRELAYEQAERVYGLAMLLVGERSVAEGIFTEAFRRMGQAFDRGQVMGDAEEMLYRHATRAALARLARSRELRGYLPATTADDRTITAFGVVGDFSPQQRAGIFLAVWAKQGYRVAGIASALGEGRVRDLVFSVRQEYRHARGAPPDMTPECGEAGPWLSAQVDGESVPRWPPRLEAHVAQCEACRHTRALYEEFSTLLQDARLAAPGFSAVEIALAAPKARPGARASGLRAWVRTAAGPGLLVATLVGALLIFRECGEPSMETGIGRTSDLIYAREGAATVVVDAGSGREVGRLGPGALTRSGDRLYGTRPGCEGRSGATTIWVADTGTLRTTDVGCAEGQLLAVAADEEAGRLYLGDQRNSWARLVFFDLGLGQVAGCVSAPVGMVNVFRPEHTAVAPDRSSLVSYGGPAGPTAVIFRTDLRSLRVLELLVVEGVRFPRVLGKEEVEGVRSPAVSLLPSDGGRGVFVYDLFRGRVSEVDPARSHVLREVDVRDDGAARTNAEAAPSAVVRGALATSPDGTILYAVLLGGGIGVVDVDRFELVSRLTPERRYRSLAVSTDGRRLYTQDPQGTYAILDASTGKVLLQRTNVPALEILQVNAGD